MVLAPLRGHCPREITYFAATPFFATQAAEVAPVTYLSTLTPESKNLSQKAQPPNGWASMEHQGPAPKGHMHILPTHPETGPKPEL